MSRSRFALILALTFLASSQVRAEIPLPDFIVYGTLCADGQYVRSGQLSGQVLGKPNVRSLGEFREDKGTVYYVLRISLETNIGAPPTSMGTAAKEGDTLGAISLDGRVFDIQDLQLKAATIVRLDIGTGCAPTGGFHRGDADGNAVLELTDAIRILNFLFLGTGEIPCHKAADADDNGGLEITDGVRVLDYLFRGIGIIPPPGPPPQACGLDPTPDNLGCVSYSGCLGAPGRGAKGKVGGGSVLEEQAGGRSTPQNLYALRNLTLRGHDAFSATFGRGDAQLTGYGVWSEFLAISPDVVHMGDLSGKEVIRTISVVSSSDLPMDLTLKSLTPSFAIYPDSIRLPPRGSYVAFIHSRAEEAGSRTSGLAKLLPLEQGIEISSGETLLARIKVESLLAEGLAGVEAGSVRILEGTAQAVAVPVVAENLERTALQLGFVYDPLRFERVFFVPAAPMRVKEERSDLLRVTLFPGDSEEARSLLGHLLLLPRTPLPTGTYPLLIREARAASAEAKEVLVRVVHGEVCAQRAWLDLDDDGLALPGYESVLGRRSIMSGIPLVPDGWNLLSRQDPKVIATLLGERTSFFDIDGSGECSETDFQVITLALAGFEFLSPDLAARAHNLSIPESPAQIDLNRLRVPLPLQGARIKTGERISIPVILDLVDPVPHLEFVVKMDPGLLEAAGFKPGVRFAGDVDTLRPRAGELNIRTEGMSGISAGFGPIGFLDCVASFHDGTQAIDLELNSPIPSISGSVTRFSFSGSDAQAVGLSACATSEWSLELSIHLSPEAPAVNLLNLELRHPMGTLSLVKPQPGSGSDRQIEAHLKAHMPGEATLLVYHPLGETLKQPEGRELLKLKLSYEQGSLLDLSRASFDVAILTARYGPETKNIRGSTLLIEFGTMEPCDSAEKSCQDDSRTVDLKQILALLEYLFQDAPAPTCLEAYDSNRDGLVTLSDIVALVESIRKG